MAELESSELLKDSMDIIIAQLKNDGNNNVNMMADVDENEMAVDSNFVHSGDNIGPENSSMTSQQMPFDFNSNANHMESHNQFDPNNSKSELIYQQQQQQYQQMTPESEGFPNACDAYTQGLMEDGGFISTLPISSLPISSVNINIDAISQSNIVNSSPKSQQSQPSDLLNNVPGTSSAVSGNSSSSFCQFQFQPPSSTLSSGHFEENNIGIEPLAETTNGFKVNDNRNTEEEKINQIIRAKIKTRNNPKNRTRGKIWIWDKPETKPKIIPELDLNTKRKTRSQTASIRNPDTNYQVITIEDARRTTTSSTSSRPVKAQKPLVRSKKPKNKKNQKSSPKKLVKKKVTTRRTTRSTDSRQENAKKPLLRSTNNSKNKKSPIKNRPQKLVKKKVKKIKDQNKGLSGTYLCCYCQEIYYYLNPFWYHFVAHEEELA